MNEQEIISRITEKLSNATTYVSGENCNFELFIVSDDFNGMKTLERQRSILDLFREELKTGKLHALSLSCKTQAEYQEKLNSEFVQINM